MPHFMAAAFVLCNGPPFLCGVYFSLCIWINPFLTYYHFSLNSFCNDTSRTWTLLGPETRYYGFWLGSSPSHMGSSPKQGFGWVWVPGHEFESQSVINSFILREITSPNWAETYAQTWAVLELPNDSNLESPVGKGSHAVCPLHGWDFSLQL